MQNHCDINYLTGFGNYFESEAIPGALPKHCNSPQQVPFNLYAEQFSGSAFTVDRRHNLRSWLYRILPSVRHKNFKPINNGFICGPTSKHMADPISPNQLRWDPIPFPNEPMHFIESLITFACNGDIAQQLGAAIHLYAFNQNDPKRYFYNADGEFLFVAQEGKILLRTELGILMLEPGEIAVIPRGVKYQVELYETTQARGYICENFGACFILPERGVIGANGLANERDFLIPQAAFEQKQGQFQLICKFQGNLWAADIDHSPLDVVAWHGNYTPYKYHLKNFNTINTVSYDHPDPSIFTVLSSASDTHNVANVDFVIFPERWMVAEHTFRPPYYHRNIMSEFMGLIDGIYDAKGEEFAPGGCSLHNCMSGHGPDANTYAKAIKADLKPQYFKDTLAFMFESRFVWQPTQFALNVSFLQKNYLDCWRDLQSHFQAPTFSFKTK